MQPLYEKRTADFTFRTNRGGKTPLQCNPHIHYHIELVYMQKGSVKAYIDSDEYLISEGDIFVVFPNRVHRFVSNNTVRNNHGIIENCEQYMLFIVSPDLMPEISKQLFLRLPKTPVIHPLDTALYDTLSLLSRFSNVDSDSVESIDLIRRGFLTAFFSQLLPLITFRESRAFHNPTMRAVVDYCSANFNRELSLDILSEELHISKYYISHLFVTKLDIHFTDYVNSLRVSEACRYLRGSDKSICEISELVGFCTQRTFNRAFVKQIGITPREYRKASTGSLTASLPV